jgi:heat shock protein HslJ
MKTKNLFLLIILLLSFGCSNNGDLSKDANVANTGNENQNISLTGTKWKLTGFANVTNGIIKTPEPDSENHYWIIFNDDNTLSGKSSNNELFGSYEADYKAATLRITKLGGTKMGEILDGELFVKSLQSVYYFSIRKTSLQLYYNDTDYLLFNAIQP